MRRSVDEGEQIERVNEVLSLDWNDVQELVELVFERNSQWLKVEREN